MIKYAWVLLAEFERQVGRRFNARVELDDFKQSFCYVAQAVWTSASGSVYGDILCLNHSQVGL